ncbi:MAG: SLBB domain-containing protein [Saprospiraceae bacterium]|nr:SLBB domain-containing protein [Saprospiraceae bacterium]MBL0085034.1 SLBB domain-containing protein [Saprospiraceae bacterium]
MKRQGLKMKIVAVILLIFSSLYINAQVVSESAAREELARRGIPEAQFRAEMLRRGINLDNIDPNNTQELLRIEREVKDALEKLEKENKKEEKQKLEGEKQKTPKTKEDEIKADTIKDKAAEDAKISNKSGTDIKKAVERGASLEEAVSENLQEKQKEKLPEAKTYGQQLFRDNSLKLYRTSDETKPPRSYVLGAGDVLAISIFDVSQANISLEVSREGYIQPDRLPRYFVAGLTIDDAERMLKRNFRNYYLFSPDNFKLSVTTARTINVNIFGEVFNNGSFNISAVNTAFNALVAAGGPGDLGSVRQIKLLRPGKAPKNIDVYQFLNNPVVSQEFYLQDNDYIQVPIAQKLISIKGGINRPMQYELLPEENLNHLLKYAGGIKAGALKRNVQVKRFENDAEVILNVDLSELETQKKDFVLKHGDEVRVGEIEKGFENKVSIYGAVRDTGEYAFVQGMKINDLIQRSVIRENAIQETAYLRRFNEDQKTVRYEIVNIKEAILNPASPANMELRKGDVLTVRALSDFAESYKVIVDGAVRNPVKFALGERGNMKVSDALFLAGGIREDAAEFAYLFRKRGDELTQEYYYIDLNGLSTKSDLSTDIELSPYDSIFVYKTADFADKAFIKVGGAVRRPGEFVYNPTLTLKDAILLSGGLKQEASPNRIDVFRLDFGNERRTTTLAKRIDLKNDLSLNSVKDYMLLPFDQIYIRYAPEFEPLRNVIIEGEVVYPGIYSLLKENMRLTDLIEMAGGLTNEAYIEGASLFRLDGNTGNVVVNLKTAMEKDNSSQNIILRADDVITIPKQDNIVSIIGATNYDELYGSRLLENGKINIAFEEGKDALYYINNYAGGIDENGDINRITVEHKNGRVEKVRNRIFYKKFPEVKEGSTINVPYKKKKTEEEKKEEKDINWGDVLKDSIAQATAILSLILLIRSVD